MKRAIYIAKSHEYQQPEHRLFSYGVTGQIMPWKGSDILCDFLPDGASRPVLMPRRFIYVPAEDLTRHCPKP